MKVAVCKRCHGTKRVPGIFGFGYHRPCPLCVSR